MLKASYPLFKTYVYPTACYDIDKVFKSGYLNEGQQVTELTKCLEQRFETDNLILLNSCTSALTVALKLAGASANTEVISTPMTCVASNTPIVNLGAKIVWADINPETGMVDPESVYKLVTHKTVALIVVCWAGFPPQLEELYTFCQRKNIRLIVDAAHAFDTKYNSEQLHGWADFVCYSFQAIKHFTTGDGGALICNNEPDYERAKALKWFGLDRDKAKDDKGDWKGQQWDVDITECGYKFNMNNISAAIGLANLQSIDNRIAIHRKNGLIYNKLLSNVEGIILPSKNIVQYALDTDSSSWVYPVLVKHKTITRDKLVAELNGRFNIMAGIVHVPNDDYTAFAEFKSDLPGVREFANTQFALPCGWWLTDEQTEYIANRVIELMKTLA